MGEIKKPKYFIILKIIGFAGVVAFIVGLVLLFKGFSDFESNNFIIGAFVSAFSLFIAVFGLANGFKPEISKMSIQSARYIQEQNKGELNDIVSTTADIVKDAVETTSNAVKNGLEDSKFCKHCGAKISNDSIFCNMCGREQ